jgi:ATP-dependent DNA helicase RecQ
MERNDLNISKYEFDTLCEQIKRVLLQPCFYEELLSKIEGNAENVVKVVRWLLENEKIVYRVDNRMEWQKG